MTNQNPDHLPDDLHEVDARLQAHKTEFSALELDELKLRTATRAFRPRTSRYGRQHLMRSKFVTMMLVLGLAVSAGTAGVIAGGNGGKSKGKSADTSQYKPGKGCGDKNHVHVREDECKKPPK